MIRTFFFFVSTLIILTVIGAAGGIYIFYTFGRGLPDYRQLADYKPPVMTRVRRGMVVCWWSTPSRKGFSCQEALFQNSLSKPCCRRKTKTSIITPALISLA